MLSASQASRCASDARGQRHAVDRGERPLDQLLGVLQRPVLQRVLGRIAQRDRRELLVDLGDAHAVAALGDRDLERARRHVLLVAFQHAAAGDGVVGQLVDEREVDPVAGLLGQVLLDLDDRVLVRPHLAGVAVFGEVFGEELVVPLFDSETCANNRVSHVWCVLSRMIEDIGDRRGAGQNSAVVPAQAVRRHTP